MSNWQPIETAPKDGTPILVYADRDGYYTRAGDIGVAVWRKQAFPHGIHEWCAFFCCDGVTTLKASQWMPLPEPPDE